MRLFQHYHIHRIDKAFNPDFWLYELAVWMHMFGRSLVAIFIPILLLKIGYTVGEVMIFYLILNIIDVPANFLVRDLIVKIGARWVIIIGKLWSIAFFLLLAFIGPGDWPLLILLAFFAAMHDVFYWVGHRFMFLKSTDDTEDVGAKNGILQAVQRFASFLGPAVGAGILIFFEQQALMYVSIAVLILSTIPLLKIDDFTDKPDQKPISLRAFLKQPHLRKNMVTTGLFSIHQSAEMALWPMFIFIAFGTIESVAIVPIIVSITAIIFSYFTGFIERTARETMIALGSLLIAIVWILRMVVDADLFMFLSISLVGIFTILVIIPLSSNIYTFGKQMDALSTSTYMNVTNMFAKVILFGILALFVNVFHVGFINATVSLVIIIAIQYLYIATVHKRATQDHDEPLQT